MCSSGDDNNIQADDLADFNNSEQQHPPNSGHQPALEGASQQNDGNGSEPNELLAVKKKCALLEGQMWHMKLKGIEEKERDNNVIEQLTRELVATQQKLKKQEKTANERYEQLVSFNEAIIVRFERWEMVNRREQEQAEKRMDQMQISLTEQIDRLKMECRRKGKKVDKQAEGIQNAHNSWRLCNPMNNRWEPNSRVKLSANGLIVTHTAADQTWDNVFAAKSFAFDDAGTSRNDGAIHVKYYEARMGGYMEYCIIGLSAEKNCQRGQENSVGEYAHSYSIYPFHNINLYHSAGSEEQFELSLGVDKPELSREAGANVFGCGVLVWPDGRRAIFFTANGTLLGKEIPIGADVPPLFPAVSMYYRHAKLVANFGDDPIAFPFAYDIAKCPVFNANTN